MSSTSAPTSNPVLEMPRRKRTRSNLSVFTLPVSLAKRPHIEEISEAAPPSIEVTAPDNESIRSSTSLDEDDTSSSSASSDADSSEYASAEEEGSGSELVVRQTLGTDEDENQSESDTSSSSSSSSSSGSLSRSPSPTPTFNSAVQHSVMSDITSVSNGFDAEGQPIDSNPSTLSARLRAFIPAMRSANEELERERSIGTLEQRSIEHQGEGEHIEMDLGLGVLKGKRDDDSDSETDTDSEASSDITETADSDVTGKRNRAERDIMGRLKGEVGRVRPDIEVVEEDG